MTSGGDEKIDGDSMTSGDSKKREPDCKPIGGAEKTLANPMFPVDVEQVNCDLAVIGTGMAGMAAALFASNRGLKTVQVGSTRGIHFASGLIDLMAVHPVAGKKVWADPWAAIEAVRTDIPGHPYARIKRSEIEGALSEFSGFLADKGVAYKSGGEKNYRIVTAMGTVKPTFLVPETMAAGAAALAERAPTLLVDFNGMKEFSARQIVETLGRAWPGLSATRLTFPGTDGVREAYNEQMARCLDLAENRAALAELIRPLVGDARYVGFPAMLGMYRTKEVIADLSARIGARVFEIPGLPVSVPGLRIKEAFESGLGDRGVQRYPQRKVLGAIRQADGFLLSIGRTEAETVVKSRGVILASGRFLGKGLVADRQKVKETIFDLPVTQPAARNLWHGETLFDPAGHAVNRAGIEVDNQFRPLSESGAPAFTGLHAAGSILAHQDWMRMKCGSGMAIATARAAVTGFLAQTP